MVIFRPDPFYNKLSDITKSLILLIKVHPTTCHEGPEGEYIYNCTLPSTSALDGGWRSTPRPGRFIPGKDPVPML